MWAGGKFHIMDNRGETWKTLLCTIPILAATLVAVSRIMDARHHPFDVITGSLLGIACAILSYRQYFPSLSEPWRKGRAYPIRTWGTAPAAPVDVKFTAASDGSRTALRNPEAERLSAPGLRERSTSPGQPIGPNVTGYANPADPYTSQVYPRRAHDHDPDGHWSSSEEDVGDGYEMQAGYAMAQNPGVNRNSVSFGTNTAYPPAYPDLGFDSHSSSAAGTGVGHDGHARPLNDNADRQV